MSQESIPQNPMQNMSKTKAVLLYIAILLTSFMVVHDVVPIVIANNLYMNFPNDGNLITFMLTGPGLLLVVSSIITGRLLEKVSYKIMLLIGCGFFAVAATLGTFVPNALYMACMRGVVGAATGIVNTAGIAMITATVVDDKRRGTMIGWYNGASSAFGIVLGLAAGWLATMDWQFAFYSYAPSILIFLFVLFFVPNIKPQEYAQEQVEEDVGDTKTKAKLGASFWIFMLVYVVYDMACIPFGYYNSLYVAEHALGNEAFAGLINSLYTLGGFLFSLAFGIIYARTKKLTSILIIVLTFADLVCVYLFPSQVTAVVGWFLLGGIYLLMFSLSYAIIPELVPKQLESRAIGIATAAYAIAAFVGSYLVTFCMDFMGTGGAVTPIYVPFLALMLVALVIEIIRLAVFKNRNVPEEESVEKEAPEQ